MQYAKLLPIVLIVGLIGCYGSNDEQAAVENTTVAKTDAPKIETVNTKTVKAVPVETFEFKNATFDAPLMLMAGDEPMKAGYSYPSPAIFDVDNDGDVEMVLGEITGTVSYCENENKSAGDPVWSTVAQVQTADGKPLKLHNW